MEEWLTNLREEENNQRLHVTREDIINSPYFQNETLIVFKAPQGVLIHVPDPDEDGDFQERRYILILVTDTGVINLRRISPYEENLETTNPDGEGQPSIPETSRANENASASTLTEEIRERIGETDASPQRDLQTELFNIGTDDVRHEQEWLNNALEDADFYAPTRFTKLPLYDSQNKEQMSKRRHPERIWYMECKHDYGARMERMNIPLVVYHFIFRLVQKEESSIEAKRVPLHYS